MKNNRLLNYCEEFFKELEIHEDITKKETYKKDLLHSIRNFLNETNDFNDKAIKVYEEFSRAYWLVENDDSIISMVREMKSFEENAGILTDKQRDHFVHSVNVFILGLAIYIKNLKFQREYKNYITHGDVYHDSYDTKHEEFLYRWGISSLFHDIAYPIEISLKQLKRYLIFISEKCGLSGNQLQASLEIKNSDVFNNLPKMNPKKELYDEFFNKYPDFTDYHTNSLSLIALEMSKSFGIEFKKIEIEIYDYVNRMSTANQIDHGYYSALIVLRWFYQLINNHKWQPAYFYYPIVSSVTAIVLHNYYKFALMKEPFFMKQMNMESHPLAFLLILCDELQDWNRKPYGVNDLERAFPNDIELNLENETLEFRYLFENGKDGTIFSEKKLKSIQEVIRLESMFKSIKIMEG